MPTARAQHRGRPTDGRFRHCLRGLGLPGNGHVLVPARGSVAAQTRKARKRIALRESVWDLSHAVSSFSFLARHSLPNQSPARQPASTERAIEPLAPGPISRVVFKHVRGSEYTPLEAPCYRFPQSYTHLMPPSRRQWRPGLCLGRLQLRLDVPGISKFEKSK